MVEVGVKELKNELSAYLRRVARGEQVRVMSRGKPVADLLPPRRRSSRDALARLTEQGRLTPAARATRLKPPPLYRAKRSASEHILAERAADHTSER